MTILVGYTPTEAGEAVVRFAIEQARAFGEDVLLFQSGEAGEGAAGALSESEAHVKQLLDEAGINHSTKAVHNLHAPADNILEEVVTGDGISMVVIGSRKRTAIGKLLLGSNAQRIILESPVPVVSVKS